MPIGKCPDCGRTAKLGRLLRGRYVVRPNGALHTKTLAADERLRCADCRFGPPMHLWKTCPKCGAQTPNVLACEVCRAAEWVCNAGKPPRGYGRLPTFLEGIDLWLQPGTYEAKFGYPCSLRSDQAAAFTQDVPSAYCPDPLAQLAALIWETDRGPGHGVARNEGVGSVSTTLRKPFKECPMCQFVWDTPAEFMKDGGLRWIGRQDNGRTGKPGLMMFNHSCGTTLAVTVESLKGS